MKLTQQQIEAWGVVNEILIDRLDLAEWWWEEPGDEPKSTNQSVLEKRWGANRIEGFADLWDDETCG